MHWRAQRGSKYDLRADPPYAVAAPRDSREDMRSAGHPDALRCPGGRHAHRPALARGRRESLSIQAARPDRATRGLGTAGWIRTDVPYAQPPRGASPCDSDCERRRGDLGPRAADGTQALASPRSANTGRGTHAQASGARPCTAEAPFLRASWRWRSRSARRPQKAVPCGVYRTFRP